MEFLQSKDIWLKSVEDMDKIGQNKRQASIQTN